jgi:hypothetical protein
LQGRLGLQWHPPFVAIFGQGEVPENLSDNLRLEASVETDPENESGVVEDDQISTRLGLFYDIGFWRISGGEDEERTNGDEK